MTTTQNLPQAQISPPRGRILGAHIRLHLLENLREPMSLIGTVAIPTAIFAFFVLPSSEVTDNPTAATGSLAQVVVFAVFSACLFNASLNVAEDRSRPFDAYQRSLPVGALPQFIGRIISIGVLIVAGVAVLAVVGFSTTAATVELSRIPLIIGTIIIAGFPLLMIGFIIGYSMSQKAALAVVQVLFFTLAFGGGLFIPPQGFPTWLENVSVWLPSRGSRDLVAWGAGSTDLSTTTLINVAAWSIAGLLLAIAAFRRDEGRRYR